MKIINVISLALFFALTTIAFNSCKKNNTGGDSTIIVYPKHHSQPIKGATVYVKFKTQELPSNPTETYDLKIIGEPQQDHLTINGLLYGNYFMYIVGYDSTIMQTVTGGIPLTIKWSERKHTISMDIPVTE